jgi:tetratricopeptide (TPR) repeat protein
MEAARVAGQTDDAALKAGCRVVLVVAHSYAGRLREGLLVAEQALAQTREDPKLGADIFSINVHTMALFMRAVILRDMGGHSEAEANLDQAAQLARQHGDAENLGWIHGTHVMLAQNTGRTEAALGHARHAVEIAEKIGSPLSRVLAYQSLGTAHILTEEWSQAIDVLKWALSIARETHTGLQREAHLVADLAQAYLGLGDNSGARTTADEAVAVARRRGTKHFECLAQLARARVLLRTEGAAASGEILTALREAQRLVEQTGGRSQEPFIHEERANLGRLTGDDATCERELREAHRLFTEMAATGHAERLAKELGL